MAVYFLKEVEHVDRHSCASNNPASHLNVTVGLFEVGLFTFKVPLV